MENRLKRILGWEDIAQLVDTLVAQLERRDYDLLLVVTRGGMVPACLISEGLNLRNIVVAAVQFRRRGGEELEEPVYWQFPDESILKGKSVLIVDDVWDSGRTAVNVRNLTARHAKVADVAVLHYKPGASAFPDETPNFYGEMTDDWIVYPWDPEEKRNS